MTRFKGVIDEVRDHTSKSGNKIKIVIFVNTGNTWYFDTKRWYDKLGYKEGEAYMIDVTDKFINKMEKIKSHEQSALTDISKNEVEENRPYERSEGTSSKYEPMNTNNDRTARIEYLALLKVAGARLGGSKHDAILGEEELQIFAEQIIQLADELKELIQ